MRKLPLPLTFLVKSWRDPWDGWCQQLDLTSLMPYHNSAASTLHGPHLTGSLQNTFSGIFKAHRTYPSPNRPALSFQTHTLTIISLNARILNDQSPVSSWLWLGGLYHGGLTANTSWLCQPTRRNIWWLWNVPNTCPGWGVSCKTSCLKSRPLFLPLWTTNLP